MGWAVLPHTSPELHTLPPSWCCPQHLSHSQIHSPATLIKKNQQANPHGRGVLLSRQCLRSTQSSTTAAARVCGWKNTSLWWQWAVGMCPYTAHVSYPSLEYKPFSSQPPSHWLSLPATAVLALGLWKSEYVSLQQSKISAISEQPHFLHLSMYFQAE